MKPTEAFFQVSGNKVDNLTVKNYLQNLMGSRKAAFTPCQSSGVGLRLCLFIAALLVASPVLLAQPKIDIEQNKKIDENERNLLRLEKRLDFQENLLRSQDWQIKQYEKQIQELQNSKLKDEKTNGSANTSEAKDKQRIKGAEPRKDMVPGHQGGGNLPVQDHVGIHSQRDYRLGFQYRFDLHYDNDMLNQTDDELANNTTQVQAYELRIDVLAKAGEDVSLSANYDLGRNELFRGYLQWSPKEFLRVLIGRDRVNEGGWDNQRRDYDSLLLNPYNLYNSALGGLSELFELQIASELMGEISLQAVRDVQAEPLPEGVSASQAGLENKRFSERQDGPAFTFSYELSQVPFVSPLLQYGTYDNGHSSFFVLGLKYHFENVVGFFDYISDSRKFRKTYKGLSESEVEEEYKHTAFTLELKYDRFKIKPFFTYVSYDVVQPGEDLPGNDLTDGDFLEFDDNLKALMFGARWHHSSAFQPHLSLMSRAATYVVDSESKETLVKSDIQINLGVSGRF